MEKATVLTVSEAMREAGVFSQQVYAAIASGRLKATRENGRWRISRASFDSWKRKLQTRRELAVNAPEAVSPARPYY